MCNCMASLNNFSATLKRGIYSSPSEMNMRNSVLQALLTRIRLINEMCIVIASHHYFQCFLEHVKVLITITA